MMLLQLNVSLPGCSRCGEVHFPGWIKVYFTIKHRKYDGNEKIEDRIRLVYGALKKGLRPRGLYKCRRADNDTPEREKRYTSDNTLPTETIVIGIILLNSIC